MAVGFASDIDGTLVRVPAAGVGRRDREAIRRFQAAGGLFGVNTGRNLEGMLRALPARSGVACDYAVLCTGACVLGRGGVPLFEHRLPNDVVAEILGRHVPRACVALVVADRYWTTSRLAGAARLVTPFAYAESLADVPEPVFGLSLLLPTEGAARRVAASIRRELSAVASCHLNRTSVDVVGAGCSKATGLAVVRREMGLRSVATIGDSHNDLPMLEAADVGFTFCNAPATVRAAATHTVASVAEALAWVIDAGM